MNAYQLDIFCDSENKYKITKPIRLIEFFAGIGFQRMGIEKVFPDLQSWKICEWAIPSILAYDIIHSKDRSIPKTTKTKEELVEFLLKKGVSLDYNVPAERKQLERLPFEKLLSLSLSLLKEQII